MTIKELAELVGVSKQAINNRINKLPDSEKPRMINNTYVIEEPLLSQLVEIYNNDSEIGNNGNNVNNGYNREFEDTDKTTVDSKFMESVINELQNDKQELYKQIDKLQQLLQNQQVLSLKANEKILTLESELKEKENKEEQIKNNLPSEEIEQEINSSDDIKLGWFGKLKMKFKK